MSDSRVTLLAALALVTAMVAAGAAGSATKLQNAIRRLTWKPLRYSTVY